MTYPPSITCPVCRMTSHHPIDIKEGYCGNCHAFTRDQTTIEDALTEHPHQSERNQ